MGDEAALVFITHTCSESAMRATLAALRELDVVHDIHAVIRVVDAED